MRANNLTFFDRSDPNHLISCDNKIFCPNCHCRFMFVFTDEERAKGMPVKCFCGEFFRVFDAETTPIEVADG